MGDDISENQFGSLRVAWLEAFVLSARHKKRMAAAAEMGVSQGTISKYIKSLEHWYGNGRRRLLMLENMWPPILTEDGAALLPKAERALEVLQELQRRPDVVETPPRPPIDPKTINVPKI